MYTPTSSDAARDPTSWVVKGSNDGTSWTTLDTRTDETFAWQRQTRAFTIAHPGIYCYYRVQFTANTGATTLSEVEFLAQRP